ncbi:MAG: methylated-DNA--[protein]-cysteine S-methyltransferase [Thermoleophilaceae bacterium]
MIDELGSQIRKAAGSLEPGYDRERLALGARSEGVLDVAYATLDSALGDLLVAITERGLVRISFLDCESLDAVVADLAARVSPRVLAAKRPLDEARHQLDAYLSGRRAEFDLDLDRSLIGPFARRVLDQTAQIPYGEVATYGQVAAAVGAPRAARATGNALAGNPIPIVIPCHRVVRGSGATGGYAGGSERKLTLLDLERRRRA